MVQKQAWIIRIFHFDILEVEDKHIEKIRLIIQPEEKTEEITLLRVILFL